jgi:uncharacterized protein YukE
MALDINDPRITLFKLKALQQGWTPDAVDAFVNEQVEKSKQETKKTETATEKTTLELEKAKKTPEELGQEEAEKEIAKEEALKKAGIESDKEVKKARIAGEKAKNIINFVEQNTSDLTYGDKPINLLKAAGVSLPVIGQYIDPKAQNWEEGRLGVAIQIATQVLGAEKRVSDKEAAAYLANIPSIWDTEKKRQERIRKLKERINADLKAQGLPGMDIKSKLKLEDIFK